jgi:hypothetical protein
MTIRDSGPHLERLGQLIAEVLRDGDAEGTFMYAEAGDQWVEVGIFKDMGEQVTYRHASDELEIAILDLWEAETDIDKKWSVLHYTISNGKFSAEFQYPNDLDSDESSYERRPRALAARFGDKPVDYSDPD